MRGKVLIVAEGRPVGLLDDEVKPRDQSRAATIAVHFCEREEGQEAVGDSREAAPGRGEREK